MNIMKMSKVTWSKGAQLAAVALVAGAAKFFYSTASVNDLRWILAPTTLLVELITAESFNFESYAGYINADHSFLIAGSCSGMNFLITAFVMLSVLKLLRSPRLGMVRWTFLPAAALISFLATIVANSVRITVALGIHRKEPGMVWMNPDQLHRFQGIFVYFGFLLLLLILSENPRPADESQTKAHSFRFWRLAVPLFVYWVMTLGIPLLNSAPREGVNFLEHSLFVLLTPLVLILPIGIIGFIKTRHGGFSARSD
jgi:exosortase K